MDNINCLNQQIALATKEQSDSVEGMSGIVNVESKSLVTLANATTTTEYMPNLAAMVNRLQTKLNEYKLASYLLYFYAT